MKCLVTMERNFFLNATGVSEGWWDALSYGWNEFVDVLGEIKGDLLNGASIFGEDEAASYVLQAKEKTRSDLHKYEWGALGYANTFTLPYVIDNIIRMDGSKMSVAEFRQKFEEPRIPCILTGFTEEWPANRNWSLEELAQKYGEQKFKCGEDDDDASVKLRMKYYLDYMKNNSDDSPLYIFDSSFGYRSGTKDMLDDYVIPPMFRDDLFNYADSERRPPHRWFVIGPARSGTSIHIDPLGTSAWNTLIQGHKRWVLIHPNAPAEWVKLRKDGKEKHPDEAVTWFNTVYKRVRSSSWPKEYPVIEARQGPGETMFVPSGWWHVVINEDDTIAVTQNYCSVVNLRYVWPKTVRGRPNLSKHWLRRLTKERPELLPLMESSLVGSLDDGNNSTSSSSSDDCTSDDSDCLNSNKMRAVNRHYDSSDDSDDSFCSEKSKKCSGGHKYESYA